MSPLAEEILTDLKDEFEDGATLAMLQKWLGADNATLSSGLTELIDANAIYSKDGRYRPRKRLHRTGAKRGTADRAVAPVVDPKVTALRQKLRLRPSEAKLALLLYDATPGSVLSMTDIMYRLYSDTLEWPDDSIVKVLVCTIRAQLRPQYGDKTITTMVGVGYGLTGAGRGAIGSALNEAVAP